VDVQGVGDLLDLDAGKLAQPNGTELELETVAVITRRRGMADLLCPRIKNKNPAEAGPARVPPILINRLASSRAPPIGLRHFSTTT
jgi:hypothetical protein